MLTFADAEGQPPKAQLDLSKSIQGAKKHARTATRWCYGILFCIFLILSGVIWLFYLDSNSWNPWAKTGLSLWFSWVIARLISEFSRSLDRSRQAEDQSTALGIYEACGNDSEQAEKILRLLKIPEDLSPREPINLPLVVRKPRQPKSKDS